MSTVNFTVVLELIDCPACGLQFGVPQNWVITKRSNHSDLYCPAGHTMAFTSESPVEKLTREKFESERQLQAKINESRHAQLVAEKERAEAMLAKRKVERRVAHGTCPCCNKTFSDLSNHMISQHKEFRLPNGKQPKQLTTTQKE